MHRVFVAPFELASRPVTHGEFAEFIADGGYQRPELWLSLGWDAVVSGVAGRRRCIGSGDGDAWRTFTLHGMVDIDAHTPVCHLSFFEAEAYAAVGRARGLPTEFEWEFAARQRADRRQLPRIRYPASAAAGRTHGGHAVRRSSSATSGNGRAANMRPTRATSLRRAPSANTTASSCAASYVLRGGVCATPRVAHPRHVSQFLPTGRALAVSPACVSPGDYDA